MTLKPNIKSLKYGLRRSLQGPQMLAFLPALCLAAYWGGGEFLLVLCALLTPLFYAVTGGFARTAADDPPCLQHSRKLEDVAQDFLETALHTGQTTACFQVEITDITEITRSLGDAAADEARQQLVARFKSALRETDFVFLSGDARITVLIAPGYRLKLDGLLDIAKRLRTTAQEPLSLYGTARHLSAAIGVASSLNFGRNVTGETWLDSASQALNEACTSGPCATRVWSDKLSRQCQSRKSLREDVLVAFDLGQIQAFFQPQVCLQTGRVSGIEALARWDHPNQGVLAPASFLQALKDSGHMDRFGMVMLTQALDALKRWDDMNFDVLTIGVNFSDIELRNPSLPDQVAWELDRTGLTPQRLVIEVVESTISRDASDVLHRNLHHLAEMGCSIDLDDYGTGHASITTLAHFPIDRIKVDQAFIRDADTRPDKKQMLRAILGMAEQLNVGALIEGIETLGEHGVAQDLGYTHAQGFLYSEPKSSHEIIDWLEQNQESQNGNIEPVLHRLQ